MKALKKSLFLFVLPVLFSSCSFLNEFFEPDDIINLVGTPEVLVVSPQDNDYVFTNFTVKGTVNFTGSVEKISLYLSDTENSTTVTETSVDSQGNFSCELAVNQTGQYTVWAGVVSANGKTGTSEKIHITAVDFLLSITSPTNDGAIWWVNSGSVSIGGIIQSSSDDTYKITVILSTATNLQINEYPGTSPWNITVGNLVPGTNYLSAYCRKVQNGDLSPQKYLTLIRDNLPPEVMITNPPIDYTTYKAGVPATIGGDADGTLSPIATVYISTNGVNFTPVSNLVRKKNRAEWQHSYTFSLGTHTIWTYAVDTVGNVSSSTNQRIIECKDLIFVSASGNDANNGLSKDSPVLTIQKAIAMAISNGFDTIWVAQGTYYPGHGLLTNSADNNYAGINITNSGIHLVGGWDENFISQASYSVLDGFTLGDNNKHILYLNNVNNVEINGFIITGGYANGTAGTPHIKGGGIFLTNSPNNTFTNCVISNNNSKNDGGGVYSADSHKNSFHGIIAKNTAFNDGGGIYLSKSYSNTIYSSISMNNVPDGTTCGGIYLYYSHNNIIKGDIKGNTSYMHECGGIYLEYSHSNVIEGTISGNISYNCGAGINLYYANNNTISGDIINNECFGSSGGGMYLSYSHTNTITSVIADNFSYDIGGGIDMYFCNSNTFNCAILNNTSLRNGGGISMDRCKNNVINGLIKGNLADNNYNGGGIYIINSVSVSNTFNCTMVNNRATASGGGFYIYQAKYNTINGIVSNNFAQSDGGGIYIYDGDYSVINSPVNYNKAGTSGGGMYSSGSDYVQINAPLIGNSAVYGGGTYILSHAGFTISDRVSGNTATTLGAALFIGANAVNTKIYSSVMTNNSGSNVIYLNASSVTGFILSNCVIGGSGNEIAIQEGGSDVTGQSFIDNTFITNTLSALYYEYTGGALINCDDGWTNINLPSFMDATATTGNKVTNIP